MGFDGIAGWSKMHYDEDIFTNSIDHFMGK